MDFKHSLLALLVAASFNQKSHAAATTIARRIGKSLSIGLPLSLTARDVFASIYKNAKDDSDKELTTPTPKVIDWVKEQVPESYRDKVTVHIASDISGIPGYTADAGITAPNKILLAPRVASYLDTVVDKPTTREYWLPK